MCGTKYHNNYNKSALERKWTVTNQKCHKLLVLLVQNLYGMSLSRALDLRNLGPKFGPIPKAKKYVFFPKSRWKIPNLTKYVWFRKISDEVVKYIENHLKLKK